MADTITWLTLMPRIELAKNTLGQAITIAEQRMNTGQVVLAHPVFEWAQAAHTDLDAFLIKIVNEPAMSAPAKIAVTVNNASEGITTAFAAQDYGKLIQHSRLLLDALPGDPTIPFPIEI